jgi:CRISPR-associated protein Csy3
VLYLPHLDDLHIPSACNNPAYQEKISTVVESYADNFKFKELAERYAVNIANGRFLWRKAKRVGSYFIWMAVPRCIHKKSAMH